MCGIAGFYGKHFSRNHLLQMQASIDYRGRDYQGVYYNQEMQVGLAHNRLSVMDISSNSNQPITSLCKRYIMVYNGEIYNTKELAEKYDLLKFSHSDTQLLVALFTIIKEQIVEVVEGMFAFAIFDTKENNFFLFRDKFGVKPLFFSLANNYFSFGSEIKVLKQLPINFSINQKALFSYMNFGFISQEKTIYNEIKQLQPAYYLKYNIDTKASQLVNYYSPVKILNSSKQNYSIDKVVTDTERLISDSVKDCCLSDVPIGFFASGGVDSSLLIALARQHQKSVNTFSVTFNEEKYNEAKYSRKIASIFKTNHYEQKITPDDAISQLQILIENMDQPFTDTSLLPTYFVSKLARKHVKVALSGDGADELFLGYGAFRLGKMLSKPLVLKTGNLVLKNLKYTKNIRLNRLKLLAQIPDKSLLCEQIFSTDQGFFNIQDQKTFLKNLEQPLFRKPIFDYSGLKEKVSFTDMQTYFYLNHYLVDDLLPKVDRASMFCNLEVRVPFLNSRLVDYVLRTKDKYKLNSRTSKYILKLILKKYLPADLVDRPKWGFSIPLNKWLRTSLSYLVENYLSESMLHSNPFINSFPAIELRDKYMSKNHDYLYHKVWQLIVLNMFLEKNNFLK